MPGGQSPARYDFSYSALSYYGQVVLAADELPGRQLLHPCPIDGFGIELPVERRQRLTLPEARLADAVGNGALPPARCLLGNHQVQELQVGQALPLRTSQGRVEGLGPQRHLQRRAVGQHPFT